MSLGLAQSFELAGKRGLRGRAADLEAQALAAEEERVRRQVAARVREQYYLAAFLEQSAHARSRSVQLLEEFANAARAKFAAAAVPYLDVVRAQIELSRARNDLLEARRDLVVARAELNLTLGRPGGTTFTLATSLAHEPLVVTEEEAVGTAAAGTRLRRARLRLKAAEASRRLAGRARVPELEIGASAQRLREEEETTAAWGAGLALNLPLPWWVAPSGLLEEADADLERLRVAVAAEEREVEAAARLAHETARTAELQVSAFETSILDDAESELRAGIQGYESGNIESLNLIDIYRTYVTSRTEYGRSLYLYLGALARLEVAGDSESGT
jgi:cobalt-zinc-cadmium efflux system outer membrane protein